MSADDFSELELIRNCFNLLNRNGTFDSEISTKSKLSNLYSAISILWSSRQHKYFILLNLSIEIWQYFISVPQVVCLIMAVGYSEYPYVL